VLKDAEKAWRKNDPERAEEASRAARQVQKLNDTWNETFGNYSDSCNTEEDEESIVDEPTSSDMEFIDDSALESKEYVVKKKKGRESESSEATLSDGDSNDDLSSKEKNFAKRMKHTRIIRDDDSESD